MEIKSCWEVFWLLKKRMIYKCIYIRIIFAKTYCILLCCYIFCISIFREREILFVRSADVSNFCCFIILVARLSGGTSHPVVCFFSPQKIEESPIGRVYFGAGGGITKKLNTSRKLFFVFF